MLGKFGLRIGNGELRAEVSPNPSCPDPPDPNAYILPLDGENATVCRLMIRKSKDFLILSFLKYMQI